MVKCMKRTHESVTLRHRVTKLKISYLYVNYTSDIVNMGNTNVPYFPCRAMASAANRDQFLKQFEAITEGVRQNRTKVNSANLYLSFLTKSHWQSPRYCGYTGLLSYKNRDSFIWTMLIQMIRNPNTFSWERILLVLFVLLNPVLVSESEQGRF